MRKRHLWIFLGLLTVLTLGVRLPGLGDQTITHPEFYTPGITFPDYVTNPLPRVTFADVIRSVYWPTDIHPPGFYFVSWSWTKAFGTSHVAIRLPSALIGTATVLLVFLLGIRTAGLPAAAAAASILALHGLHINKSVQSELWIWPAFYAVASVVLLLAHLDRPSLPRWLAYVAVLTLGLWTEYSFWVFTACQMMFVGLRAISQSRFRSVVEGQALAVVVALPVLIHLRNDLLNGAREYLSSRPLS